jgi:hypothetical protein
MSPITIFEHNMTTTRQLDDMVRFELSHFQNETGQWYRTLDLWRRLIRSKTGPGEYHLTRPLFVACVFTSHPSCDSLRFPCLKLTDDDIVPTRTQDPTQVGLYECTLSMHVDPVWELDEELAFVHNPPSACRVSLRLEELTFYKEANVASLQEAFTTVKTIALEISSGEVYSPSDIYDLIQDIRRASHFFHHPFSDDIPAKVWWDLILARHSKNEFKMPLPFQLRITSTNARLPRRIADAVMTVDPGQLREFGFPPTLNPDTCIGLYSAQLYLALQMTRDAVLLVGQELWPDIQPVLTEKIKAPKCHVTLLFFDVKFVALVRKDEVAAMVHGDDCAPRCCGWMDRRV